MADSVTESIEAKKKMDKTKATLEAGVIKAWGRESLNQILGDELMPANPSEGFLETLRTLIQHINDSTIAKFLLIEVKAERLAKVESIKNTALQLKDLNAVLKRVKNDNLTHQSTIKLPTERTSARIQASELEKTEREETVEGTA